MRDGIYHLYQDSGIKETHFNDKNMAFSITNLFGAGTDTTAATLQWILLLMAKYPHVQGKRRESVRGEGFHCSGCDPETNVETWFFLTCHLGT